MKISLISLLIFCLIFTNNQSILSAQKEQFDIIKYHLKIDINFNERNITASNKITAVKYTSSFNIFELDFYNNLSIDEIKSGNLNLDYRRNGNKLFIDISSLNSDTMEVIISYQGKPKNRGFDGFVFAETKKQKIVQTINQPNLAPSWFPCNDDPSDKAELEIEIINDDEFITVSNGKLIDVQSLNKKKKYHYKTHYPIATNLIGFYSSNYQEINEEYISVNGKKMNLYYYVFPDDIEKAKVDLQNTKEILKTFEKLFGEYPFIEEKFSISEILLMRGAIENQTLIGISKDLFSGKNFHKDVFIHEVAHSWWGNAVGISGWKDVWLSEAFAKYSEALFYEYNFGKPALHSRLNKFLSENFSGRVYNPENLFSKSVYYKGALVLNMIRNILTDSLFFNFIKNYYHEFKYKSVSTEEFKNYLEKYSGKDFTKFFDDWIYNDRGIINCEYSIDEELGELKLNQKNYVFNFNLDIKVVYEDDSFDITSTYIDNKENLIKLNPKKNIKEIILDPDMRLLAKFEQAN